MLTYNQLVQIVVETAAISLEGIERNVERKIQPILFQSKPIKVITGIRRCGKSFLIKRLYKRVLENGVPPENVLFLNFEDDRLFPYLSQAGLRSIYEQFLANVKTDKMVFLFLDEIQNIPNWEHFVRTIYDSTQHNIFVTGSNSHLLSKEFSSLLGGRLLEYTVFPFSFAEFLENKNVVFKPIFERAKNILLINKYYDEYFNYGGLCEVADLPDEARINYRKSLIDKIIINDITNRYRLHSIELLVNLLKFLEKNTGCLTSYRKIANQTNTNENTVEQYISYLENAFIVDKLRKFSWKTNSFFDTNRKYYFIDNIFCHLADLSNKLENLCYQHFVRTYGGENVFLGRDDKGKEVDFVVRKNDTQMLAIQVCYELNNQNLHREISSLLLFEKYMGNYTTNSLQVVYFYNQVTNPIPENIELIQIIDLILTDCNLINYKQNRNSN